MVRSRLDGNTTNFDARDDLPLTKEYQSSVEIRVQCAHVHTRLAKTMRSIGPSVDAFARLPNACSVNFTWIHALDTQTEGTGSFNGRPSMMHTDRHILPDT